MDIALPDTRRLELSGPAGRLEARLDLDRAGAPPAFLAVFGHPDPQRQGTMFNNVVVHASRTLVHRGGAVLRFNYRGVGASQGRFDQGVGERDDYRVAMRSLRDRFPEVPILIAAGFSFGAIRAMECALPGDADAHLGVAPPITLDKYRDLPAVRVPSALVLAGADELVSRPDEAMLARHYPQLLCLEEVEGAGHLFTEHLAPLRAATDRAVQALLERITA